MIRNNISGTNTRQQLLENFDEEVHEKLKVAKSECEGFQNRYEKMLMRLTRRELDGHAAFADSEESFDLTANPFPDLEIPTGRYELPRRAGKAHFYRLGHPLALRLVRQATERTLAPAEVVFDWEGTKPRVGALNLYRGCNGELLVRKLSVESVDQAEDHLLVAAVTSDGRMVPAEVACKFFSLSALEVRPVDMFAPDPQLVTEIDRQQADELRKISERNARLFEEEANKLDGWAEDLKIGLEREIGELDRQLREAQRAALAGVTLDEKIAGQRLVKKLEGERNDKRRKLFAAQDEIEKRRDELIESVQAKLKQKLTLEPILSIRWRLR